MWSFFQSTSIFLLFSFLMPFMPSTTCDHCAHCKLQKMKINFVRQKKFDLQPKSYLFVVIILFSYQFECWKLKLKYFKQQPASGILNKRKIFRFEKFKFFPAKISFHLLTTPATFLNPVTWLLHRFTHRCSSILAHRWRHFRLRMRRKFFYKNFPI